jgi:uncharacterized membrane protein
MNLLTSGLIVFLAAHLVPSIPVLRQRLIRGIGERPYKGLFALLSLAGFVLIVIGKARAGFISLWEPAALGYEAPRLLMPLSFMLIAGAQLPGNLKRFTRHPMLWGIVLWAGSHLFANGDLASVVLFGAFGTYSLFAMWSQNQRGARLQTTRKPLGADALVVAIGLGTYVAFGLVHRYLFGVPAFS